MIVKFKLSDNVVSYDISKELIAIVNNDTTRHGLKMLTFCDDLGDGALTEIGRLNQILDFEDENEIITLDIDPNNSIPDVFNFDFMSCYLIYNGKLDTYVFRIIVDEALYYQKLMEL